MQSIPKDSPKVVGTKQLARALAQGLVSRVYVAMDADTHVTRDVLGKCRELNIPVSEVPTMKELGAGCGISVGAALCGLLRAQT